MDRIGVRGGLRYSGRIFFESVVGQDGWEGKVRFGMVVGDGRHGILHILAGASYVACRWPEWVYGVVPTTP